MSSQIDSTTAPALLEAKSAKTRDKKAFEWLKSFASYSLAQSAAQGIGFVAGILVLRALPKNEYAWYMIANTIGPMMNLLSDSGVGSGLSAIGGRFWQDDEQMGSLISAAAALRRRLVVVSCLAIIPILVWLLNRNQAPAWTIVALISFTTLGVLFQINVSVLSVVLMLRQQVARLRKLALMGTLPRLLIIAFLIAIGRVNAWLAAAAGAACLGWQWVALKRWVKPQLALAANPNPSYQREILAIVKRQAPMTIYFCIQSQITSWLISIFGDVSRVADVGALGRLGMIFSILMTSTCAIIIPRFARCQDRERLKSHYILIFLGFLSCVAATTSFVAIFPKSLLWLLGAQYAHLGNLVWMVVLGSGLTNVTGVLYFMNTNKGWIPPARILIPVEVATQVALCFAFNVTTVKGVLWVGVLGPLTPGLVNFIVGVRTIARLPKNGIFPVESTVAS